MTPLALSLLLSLSPPATQAPPPAADQNVVRVCSVAAGTCESFAAHALEPAASAPAQRVFLDPATKAVVPPSQSQIEEIALSVDETQKSRETSVEKRADGTLKLTSTTGFAVDQRAVIHPTAKQAAKAKAAKPAQKTEEKP
jgi:hypothetical protein